MLEPGEEVVDKGAHPVEKWVEFWIGLLAIGFSRNNRVYPSRSHSAANVKQFADRLLAPSWPKEN